MEIYTNIPFIPLIFTDALQAVLGSIVVSIPVCHTGDRGSIPHQGVYFLFCRVLLVSKSSVEFQEIKTGKHKMPRAILMSVNVHSVVK